VTLELGPNSTIGWEGPHTRGLAGGLRLRMGTYNVYMVRVYELIKFIKKFIKNYTCSFHPTLFVYKILT
jgi:hypothetical protein